MSWSGNFCFLPSVLEKNLVDTDRVLGCRGIRPRQGRLVYFITRIRETVSRNTFSSSTTQPESRAHPAVPATRMRSEPRPKPSARTLYLSQAAPASEFSLFLLSQSPSFFNLFFISAQSLRRSTPFPSQEPWRSLGSAAGRGGALCRNSPG